MRTIYCDESTFSEPRPCTGVGMLITESELASDLIETALKNLSDDKDRLVEPEKTLDDRTISRKFFHASEDSKNAHSHLCDQINSISSAEFVCDFFDKDKLAAHEQYDNYLYRQATILSSVKATYTADPITIHFENRTDLSLESIGKVYRELEESSLMGIYDLPYIPHFFPKVDFKIVDKSDPGIQCADFILWTVNRAVNGKNVWLERIKSPIKSSFSTKSGSWGGKDIKLGMGLKDPVIYYTITDFPVDSDKSIDRNLYINFFLHAAKVVEYYLHNPSPHITHLLEEAKDAADNKTNASYDKYFDKLAIAYLKLFDMTPVINNSMSSHDKEFLLLSKKYMSLLLRRDLIDGVITRNWLENERHHIIRTAINLLK